MGKGKLSQFWGFFHFVPPARKNPLLPQEAVAALTAALADAFAVEAAAAALVKAV